jgi:hypothetical protein
MPVAIVAVILRGWIDVPGAPVAALRARNRSFLLVIRKAVVRRLMIARQEAVAVPPWRRPLMRRRCRRDDRQQRQDDSNQGKYEAPHEHTIGGRLLRGDSNLSARSTSGSLAVLLRKVECAAKSPFGPRRATKRFQRVRARARPVFGSCPKTVSSTRRQYASTTLVSSDDSPLVTCISGPNSESVAVRLTII